MSSTKKQLIPSPAASNQINAGDNVPQVEHDYEGDEAAQKYGDFGPQYHKLAVCCDNRDYRYLGEGTCTDGWHETRQECLSCGNHFSIWRAPREDDQHDQG